MSPSRAAAAAAAEDADLRSRPLVEHQSIHEALYSALAMFTDLERTKTAKVDTRGGAGYSYSYTDLADVLGYVRPILAMHGLVVTNPVGMEEGVVSVRTRFLYRDGSEDLSPEIRYPFSGTPQQFGGIVTYLRRYSTLAACGLATEDTDAQDAPSAAKGRARAAPRAPEAPPRETGARSRTSRAAPSSTAEDPPPQAQFIHLQSLLRAAHLDVDRDRKLAWISGVLGRQITTTNEVSRADVEMLITVLEDNARRDIWNLNPPDEPPPPPSPAEES